MCFFFAGIDGATQARPSESTAWPQVSSGSNNFQVTTIYAHTVDATEGAAGETTSDLTWSGITDSTTVAIWAYRGALGLGPNVSNVGGVATTIVYPALTLTETNSMVVAVAFHRSTTGALQTPPSGLTNRFHVIDSVDQMVVHDGLQSSWPETTVDIGGSTSGWRTHVFELLLPSGGGPTLPTLSSASFASRVPSVTLTY